MAQLEKMRLGRTGLTVSRCGFGALPIQRTPMEEAVRLLRRAYAGGIDFFDTARNYSDSEEKLGRALADVRQHIVIATKSSARSRVDLLAQLATSLRNLKTDHVDLLQLHNVKPLPDPADPAGAYAGLVEAREKGMTRFVGATCHSLETALAAARSGLYDTVQFPLSSLSSDAELALVDVCLKQDVGLIAMKALSGGLITNVASAFAFLRQFSNVIPIWGIQRERELEEFLSLEASPPQLTDGLWQAIREDRRELAGSFCRGCGYCLPCPRGIQIPVVARMSLLLRRAPYQGFISAEWQGNMARVKECTECGQCRKKCPYQLDTPQLLKANLTDYEDFVASHAS
jgi:aryl-alcohol dehydrogenase-like predicted oxidoreductase